MRRYLLGEMTGRERKALEREYFADPALFERLVAAENELLDQYARGRLSPRERERFERHYLSHPARRERAELARALHTKLEPERAAAAPHATDGASWWLGWFAPARVSRPAWALAASLVLVATGAAWLLVGTRMRWQESAADGALVARQEQTAPAPQRQVTDEPPAGRETPGNPAPPAPVRQTPPPRAKTAPAVASLLLTVAGTREANAPAPSVLNVPAGTRQVRLRLNLAEDDHRDYSAVLQAAGGREVYSWRRLTPGTSGSRVSFALALPAEKLAGGDYVLTLRGVGEGGETEDVSKSLFRVERK